MSQYVYYVKLYKGITKFLCCYALGISVANID